MNAVFRNGLSALVRTIMLAGLVVTGTTVAPGDAHGNEIQLLTIAAKDCTGADASDPFSCGTPIPGAIFRIGGPTDRFMTGQDGIAVANVASLTPGWIFVNPLTGPYSSINLRCVAAGKALTVKTADVPTANTSFYVGAPAGDAIDCAMSFGLIGDDGAGPREPITVFAIGCDADPGRVGDPGDASFPPAGCAPQPGVTLSITTGDARPLGACVTALDGRCGLAVPVGQIILREDPATVPAGYEPIANPVLLRATQAPPGIVNVRKGALTRPAGSASLTVHSRVCPLEYTGSDYYAYCHGTPPDFPQTVFLIGEQGGPDARSAQIDANGNVVFDGLAAESYTIIGAGSRLVARTYSFCSRADSPGVEYPSTTVPGAWGEKTIVDLDDGAAIVCDLYVVPADRVNG